MGNTGINMSKKGEYRFDSNYYLKTKTKYVLMTDRPSFDDLFSICFSDDIAINDMFIMGQNGGCDYKYFNQNGKVALEGRFGHTSNGLHFENLDEGKYDMEFSFHDGDLILTVRDITLVKEEKKSENTNQPLVINIKSLPLSDSDIDFHELMLREENRIIFSLDIEENIDGNILNQDDIDLFAQRGKEFSIKTNFIQVDFDKDTITEMEETNNDLSMHIKNGLSFFTKEETEDFMNRTYARNITDDMKFVCIYEVMIFLSEHDLIGGEFKNRPKLTLYPYKDYLKGIDFRKVSVFSDIDADNSLDFIGGKNKDGGITIKLENSVPYHYFNLYERGTTFDDISENWARDYIEVMAAKNIINGVGNGLYKPKDKLTKAQFLTLLIRGIDADISMYEGIYSDCKESDWFTPYVEAACNLAIIERTEDSMLNPNSEISRQDMAVMAVKAYEACKSSLPQVLHEKPFIDEKDIDSEALDYIKAAVQLELISGMPDGSFRPLETLTREQASKIIYQLVEN
jgi:hypothetical protein